MNISSSVQKCAAPFHALFSSSVIRSSLLAVRPLLVLGACALLIPLIDRRWFLPGLAVSLVGALGQLWCFGSLRKQKVLCMQGPYSLVRNPMYLARYLLILGAVLFTGNLWLVLGFTAVYYFYMVNRVRREESKLQAIFGPEYADYCARLNRFVPRYRWPDFKALWFFRWDYFVACHGHWNLLGVMAFYLVCAYFVYLR